MFITKELFLNQSFEVNCSERPCQSYNSNVNYEDLWVAFYFFNNTNSFFVGRLEYSADSGVYQHIKGFTVSWTFEKLIFSIINTSVIIEPASQNIVIQTTHR